MRKGVLALSVAAVCFAVQTASGDVLVLANGGQLAGKAIELEFVLGGVKTRYAGDEVEALTVAATAKDTLRLRSGKQVEGELALVKFKSVGGELSFERAEVASLTTGEDQVARARKELEAKKAALPANDARALCDLAAWCAEKGLKTEAAQFARQSLALDPNAEFAGKAHEFAGDVLYKGRWMTPAEMLKLKEQEKPDEPKPGPDPKPKEPKPPEEKKIVDGTFTGMAKGFAGPVTVSVKVADGKITDCKVVKHRESRPKTAIAAIPSRIVEKNATDVDVVTGASITSRAIMKAAEEALASRTRKPADGIPDGVYTGAARGFVTDVKVSVRVKDGRFDLVKVVQNRESRALTALTDVPQRMMDQQKPDVDTVTHATISSRAIIAAVQKALDDARKKPEP